MKTSLKKILLSVAVAVGGMSVGWSMDLKSRDTSRVRDQEPVSDSLGNAESGFAYSTVSWPLQ